MQRFISFMFCWTILSFIFTSSAHAYYTGMPASIVMGQSDFTSGSADQGSTAGANTLDQPSAVAYDPSSKKLLVVDRNNNRILIYNSIPASNNIVADVVIGQTNFTSTSVNQGGSVNANTLNNPTSVSIHGGRLFVADGNNHRILIYNSIPVSNNASADIVVGQPNFTSNSQNQGAGTTSAAANTLSQPRGVYTDGSKLFISDGGNCRVLIYNSIPVSNDASADVVVGQANFTSRSANQGGGTPAANTLANTDGNALVVNNKLVIADHVNHRVLIFNQIPTANNASADIVLGQYDMTSVAVLAGTNNTRRPIGLASDGKRLFVATNFSNRIIVYNTIPSANTTPHDVSIGQPNVIDNSPRITVSGMWNPWNIAFAEQKLIVTDTTNNRVLIYDNVLSGPQLSMNSPETISAGKLKVTGSIQLGERPRYSLQIMQANVNGQGFGNVSHISGGRDNGADQTLYDFYHEFEPWAGISAKDQYDQSKGYTLQLKASSYNAEDDNIFYFQPFELKSIVGNTLNINLNSDHWSRIKENLDSFEIQIKKGTNWTTILDEIPLDSESIISTKTLNGEIRLVAKDKWGHRQETNSIKLSTGVNSYNPNFKFATAGFPLQINKITGVNTGMISTYMSLPKTNFVSSTTRPTFSGIAFAGSTVTVLVTDPAVGRSQTFITTTKDNSTWSIAPVLYNSSVIDTWVTDNAGRYTELPAIILTRARL